MDIALVNVLLRLNRTPSPPNHASANNRQQPLISNTREASDLLNNTGGMEANNLSQTATGGEATARDPSQAIAAAAAANEPYTERNLALKLPLLSSSSSDSESENPTNATAGTSAIGDGDRSSSPPPNCAICLGRCKNKCFTDSCMHQFCFKCLCEWSKVKPECPLCKQTFKSIIHNVKSIHQFEEYHVQPPTVQIAHPPFEMDFQEMRIFGVVHPGHNRNTWNDFGLRPLPYSHFSSASPYSFSSHTGSIPSASGSGNRAMALTGNGGNLRNQYVYRGELLDLYRQDIPRGIANSGTLSQLWRRYVYDRKLYAMPVADITGRFRECSARFYRDNPSQIHRLMPWINRDIVCLLRQTQHDVTTVLESINSALTLLNILSPAFRRRLQQYLGAKTAHFIHELYNFARSPYDMVGYDRAVQYSPQTNEEIVIEFTSSDESTDNEHHDESSDVNRGATTMSTRSSRSTHASSTNAINLTIHNRLTSSASSNAAAAGGQNGGNAADIPDDVSLVIDLRGESDNNETISTGQATINSSIGQNVEVGDVVVSSVQQPTVAENIELTSGSSDECEFILERKPPHLRTPEMVSLDSASDSDVVFVDESKPLNKTSFSSSEDDDCNGNKQRDLHNHHHQHQHNTRNSASASTRSQITALVEAKKRNHTENLVKSEQQDSQTEIYNLGASTSAALRLSLQKRNNKSKRSEGSSRSRRLRREKYSLRNNERQMPKSKRGKHLDSESSHSSTSTNSSSSSTSSFSDNTSSTGLSTNSSDEEYVATLSQKRRTSSSVRADGSNKRRRTKKTKKRKTSNGSTSYSRAKREAKKNKLLSTDNSSEDDDEENNGHLGKNFALVMAISERLQRQQNQSKRSSNKKAPAHTTREPIEDDSESEGENSWRLKAVNEPLRRQQQQQQQQQQHQRVKSSLRSNERKRHHKSTNSQEQSRQRTEDTYREKDDKNSRRRTKTEKPIVSDSETGKPQKIRKFEYDESSSSDESDNINLIQLKTKLTGQDQQNKETTGNSKNVSLTPSGHNREHLEASSGASVTNNLHNSNDVTAASGTETTVVAATVTTENSETHTIIPTTYTTSATNEQLTNNLPSTSHDEAIAVLTAAASAIEENNFIESLLKNDFHNSSDDSNDDYDDDLADNGQNNRKYNNNDDENNDNHQMNNNNNTENHQQPEETSSSLLAKQSNSTNIVSLQNPYHSDVTEDEDDEEEEEEDYNNRDANDDDEDDIDDVDDVPPSKISLNTNLNVFADATSMTSTTTTDTILHDAAEQISSAAVNFYNSHQQELQKQQQQHEQEQLHEQQQQSEQEQQQQQQQPLNTADFGDENSTNTSSTSDTSLISSSTNTSSSSSSSSSSISNSFNTNIFMNFKNV